MERKRLTRYWLEDAKNGCINLQFFHFSSVSKGISFMFKIEDQMNNHLINLLPTAYFFFKVNMDISLQIHTTARQENENISQPNEKDKNKRNEKLIITPTPNVSCIQVRARCNFEWKEFERRMDVAEKDYLHTHHLQ